MEIIASDHILNTGKYAFAEVDKIKGELKAKGIEAIDFGVGDPADPTPEFVREALKAGADKHATSGYPSYIGMPEFRQACADWMKSRFGVDLDANTEITSSIGSKEAIFNFPQAFVNPGDVVIIPSPGYPPMKTGTKYVGATPYFVPLLEENDYMIDYNAIPEDVAEKAKIIWTNYPNSPTGKIATRQYYEGLIEWAQKHNIIIAADEGCYIDVYLDDVKPMSILEIQKEGIITFYSLSKRNNMTGYRAGWCAGDERIIEIFKKLKTNIDSGTPNFVQEAAIAALKDENHAQEMRDQYRTKRDIMIEALQSMGLDAKPSDATFYLWVKGPEGMSSLDLAKKFLADEVAVVVTPGAWISDECEGGINPGEGYVRFALVPTVEKVKEAAERIKNGVSI